MQIEHILQYIEENWPDGVLRCALLVDDGTQDGRAFFMPRPPNAEERAFLMDPATQVIVSGEAE